jgi:hypothetical protein
MSMGDGGGSVGGGTVVVGGGAVVVMLKCSRCSLPVTEKFSALPWVCCPMRVSLSPLALSISSPVCVAVQPDVNVPPNLGH